jgi:hypothetical protein
MSCLIRHPPDDSLAASPRIATAANLVDPGIRRNEPEDVPEDVIHVGDLADILADVGIEDADLLAVHVFGDGCQSRETGHDVTAAVDEPQRPGRRGAQAAQVGGQSVAHASQADAGGHD